jgi:hypothetical protein
MTKFIRKTENPLEIKIDEIPKPKVVEKKQLTVRQFLYDNNQCKESLIIALERAYGQQKKTDDQWLDEMIRMKVNF